MGKKKTTYLLLGAVALVWGLIISRIYNAVHTVDIEKPQEMELSHFKPTSLKKAPKIELALDYKDPFLGHFTNATNKSRHSRKTRTKSSPLKPIDSLKVIFPSIQYKGIIAPKQREDKRYILTINGKVCLYKKNETKEAIQLLEGDQKSIRLLYKGVTKTIPLLTN